MVQSATRDEHVHNSDTICEAITSAVAAAEECSIVDLDPLYETVDVNALSRLFASTALASERAGTVTFHYHGYDVIVSIAPESVTVLLDEDATV